MKNGKVTPMFKNKPYRFKNSAEKRRVGEQVWERDNYTCQNPMCSGESQLDSYPHHIRFLSQSGEDKDDNLVTVCMECHDLIHKRKLYVNKKREFRKAL